MIPHVSKRAIVNGVNLRYIIAGEGPVVLSMHGWPQSHREFAPVIERLAGRFRFIAPDLRGFGDSDKPYSGYEPKTIARDMLDLLEIEAIDKFHILSHDLGGPPSVAVAYMAATAPSRSRRSRLHSSASTTPAMSIRACRIGISACT